MRRIVLAAFAALVGVAAHSANSGDNERSKFLCIVDLDGGLHYDSRNMAWIVTNFKPGHKYIIRKSNPDDLHGKYAEMYKIKSKNRPSSAVSLPEDYDPLDMEWGPPSAATGAGKTAGPGKATRKPAPSPEIADWLIFDIDSEHPDFPLSFCWNKRDGLTDQIDCPDGMFDFDKKTLRFQMTYVGGYLEQGSALYEKEHPSRIENGSEAHKKAYKSFLEVAEHPDDAFFAIGKCAPF